MSQRRARGHRAFSRAPGIGVARHATMPAREKKRGGMESSPGPNLTGMGAVDARAIVPVEDAHGGVTIYYQGRPTHYLLAGEWYRALPAPGSDFAD